MFIRKLLGSLILFVIGSFSLSAESIRVSQIDTNKLLLNQQVKLYISLTNNQGRPIQKQQKRSFKIFESGNGRTFQIIPEIKSFQVGANYEDGISFLLLIDNSESMYWTMEGRKTKKDAQRRITHAKSAVTSFLGSITNPKDKVGLAVYNSSYLLLSSPTQDKKKIEKQLADIQRPQGDGIYSEIYGSVQLAIDEFSTIKGRKAIIILSDGVNNPSYTYTKKINEQFGERFVSYQKPTNALQLEGISLYVVNFGKKGQIKDRHLSRISERSGGVTFNAHSRKQLQAVYLTIIDQILKEYIITYRASMLPAEKKTVKVAYTNKRGKDFSTTRSYLASTVFGQPGLGFNPFYFIAFIVSVLLLWLLTRIKFEKQRAQPSIEILNAGAGNVSTQILDLGNAQTIIGSASNADMTIAGVAGIEENHVTVAFDEKSNQYTLIGTDKVLVNNQAVTTKVLEPGDLINLDGVTMIFDEGTEQDKDES
jgi:Ca-activated chloride channel homolog